MLSSRLPSSLGETSLRELLDNIPVGIGVAGPVEADGTVRQDANIVYYNREWVRLFGFDAEEVRTVSQATQRLYPNPELRQEMIRLRREAADRRQRSRDSEQMEAVAMGANGQWLNVMTGTSVIHGMMIVSMLDITARKKAELSLAEALNAEKEARATAERAVHLKSLFLASVSHEIRTPLSALISLAQAMCLESEKHKLSPEFTLFLNRVRSGGNYLNLILSNLLDISATEFGHAPVREDCFYLFDWVSDLKNILEPISSSHQVHLVWEFPEDSEVRLKTDQTRLTQILLNLAHNAIKFSGSEGRHVTISLAIDGEALTVTVVDEGPGISPERIPELFREFDQCESVPGPFFDRGVGLGLAVVQRNARLLGGHVDARNLAPTGMCFTVSLPSVISY